MYYASALGRWLTAVCLCLCLCVHQASSAFCGHSDYRVDTRHSSSGTEIIQVFIASFDEPVAEFSLWGSGPYGMTIQNVYLAYVSDDGPLKLNQIAYCVWVWKRLRPSLLSTLYMVSVNDFEHVLANVYHESGGDELGIVQIAPGQYGWRSLTNIIWGTLADWTRRSFGKEFVDVELTRASAGGFNLEWNLRDDPY